MKKILYVNAAMNRESSRTERLAQAYLKKQTEKGNVEIQTVTLAEEKNALSALVDAAAEPAGINRTKGFQHALFPLCPRFCPIRRNRDGLPLLGYELSLNFQSLS